jgi:DNA ligase-1
LITQQFPEFHHFLSQIPNGTVIDGEILCANPEIKTITPLPFSLLQKRISRKKLSKKIQQDAPVIFVAYDLIEWQGVDLRNKSLSERKNYLAQLVDQIDHPHLRLSAVLPFDSWSVLFQQRSLARSNATEGLMLKRKTSFYLSGRKKGDWWKWKVDPLVIDCVLVYAQKGHGRRSNLYTDYTFAVKDGDRLVTFTKAYSGLTDDEFKEVDRFIKNNAIESFGPVKTVKAELVFELAFEGIAESKRHKAGIALRFPRMKRIRKDKPIDEINTLDDLKKMLLQYGN